MFFPAWRKLQSYRFRSAIKPSRINAKKTTCMNIRLKLQEIKNIWKKIGTISKSNIRFTAYSSKEAIQGRSSEIKSLVLKITAKLKLQTQKLFCKPKRKYKHILKNKSETFHHRHILTEYSTGNFSDRRKIILEGSTKMQETRKSVEKEIVKAK